MRIFSLVEYASVKTEFTVTPSIMVDRLNPALQELIEAAARDVSYLAETDTPPQYVEIDLIRVQNLSITQLRTLKAAMSEVSVERTIGIVATYFGTVYIFPESMFEWARRRGHSYIIVCHPTESKKTDTKAGAA
mgnify:CR=1 FL=1